MKTLGVIGGLGPIATAYFYELLVRMTDSQRDQDHIEMLIYSKPSIPDRTEYILGRSKESPVMPMIEVGKSLTAMGADFIAIPCITAHYFYEQLTREIRVTILNVISETVKHLRNQGIHAVGIMATEGTIFTGLFQEELMQYGMCPIIPNGIHQGYINGLIYDDVKSNRPPQMDRFYSVADELKNDGAEAIILGCTELSLIKRDYVIGSGFIDAMEVLSSCSILHSGAKLKEEYKTLITNKDKTASTLGQLSTVS